MNAVAVKSKDRMKVVHVKRCSVFVELMAGRVSKMRRLNFSWEIFVE